MPKKRIYPTKKELLSVSLNVFLTLIWVGASIIAVQFAVGYLMLWCLGPTNFIQPVWTAVYSALSYALAMFLIIFIPKKITSFRKKSSIHKKNLSEPDRIKIGLRDFPTWTDIGLAPAGFIVYLLIVAALTAIFNFFPWFQANEVQEIGFSTYAIGLDRVIAFVTLVVIAPIAEEVIFRGWLYGKLREKISESISEVWSTIISIFLVSLLFGIMHGQWNVGLNVFALSIVLCGLREITGTIYAGILLHMLKNGLAFYLLFVMGVS